MFRVKEHLILGTLSVLAFVLLICAPVFALPASGRVPEAALYSEPDDSESEGSISVIVKLNDDSAAAYRGGVSGLAPTNTQMTGALRLDVRTSNVKAYLSFLDHRLNVFEADVLKAIPRARIIHRFRIVFGGLSMLVPRNRLALLASMPAVKAVYLDELLHLDTDRSPEFIGATELWKWTGGTENAGHGVVVGVLDTGIWPEHPSFSDPDPAGKSYPDPPERWNDSTCEFGSSNPDDPSFACNNKLIGADRIMETYDANNALLPGEFQSARDDGGHGTHTSSTAGGNYGVDVVMLGMTRDPVSGIAPRAHVAMYKVCGYRGCYSSDSMAAVEEAVADGVDVINFSISGGQDPFSDPVSLAFLDAYKAGLFIAASAGNSGPGADTVGHREPWTMTVGAGTTDRHFISTVVLSAGDGSTLTLSGASITEGINTPKPVVLAADFGDELCLNPFAAGTFNGEIVVCKRGENARVQKSYNAGQGGASGMLLYNPTFQGLSADNHFIPGVHLENDAGASLLNFLSSHNDVTATFTAGSETTVEGDAMAAFSSRGGPGQTLGISKPDVTAPGVQILAGHTPTPATDEGGRPGELFQCIQGTSMSSPHVAGAAALLKDMHPDWSPGTIKSALMTTAKTELVFKEDGSTPFDPFDAGSGRINLEKAGNPGLIFASDPQDYETHREDLWNANYPSLYIPALPDRMSVQRTVHNELCYPGLWKLWVDAPSDLQVSVPRFLFVRRGADKTFDITVDASEVPQGEVRHAVLHMKFGRHEVTFPITVVRRDAVAAAD